MSDAIDALLARSSSEGKPLVLVLGTVNCKWCDKLHVALKDGVFQTAVEDLGAIYGDVVIPSKDDETRDSCSDGACRITTRNRFGIKSMPTVLLVDSEGMVCAKTEFIDSVEQVGGVAYSDWLRGVIHLAATL